jgi:hypothetical protein
MWIQALPLIGFSRNCSLSIGAGPPPSVSFTLSSKGVQLHNGQLGNLNYISVSLAAAGPFTMTMKYGNAAPAITTIQSAQAVVTYVPLLSPRPLIVVRAITE